MVRKKPIMRINRAIGLLIFLVVAHVLLSDMFGAVSRAFVSTMQTFETASQTATLEMIEHR
jgi:hypothetical protein